MKILALSDTEERSLWDHWNEDTAKRLSDVGLVLSAGDLHADYLEFIVTMLNVPLVYVRGNHDGSYDKNPPGGCIDADGKVIEVKCPAAGGAKGYRESGAEFKNLRILGLGGSMRYKDGATDMYTETEMSRRVMKAGLSLAAGSLRGKNSFDILLTHAPCKGYGDMEDLPHRGFECFEWLLDKYHPVYHVYGHVHKAYGSFQRTIEHPSGTRLVNACGYQLIEI